jgi:hypothetical protein
MSKVSQHPLLVFLVQMTQSILLREIAYLKAENTILRSRCPKQIQTTPAERSLLVRLGVPFAQSQASSRHHWINLRVLKQLENPATWTAPTRRGTPQ